MLINRENIESNLDINKQTAQAEDFMTKGVDVLIMTPVNEEGVVPILRKAKAEGTPVVLEGNPAKGMTTLFAICDYDAGYKAGDAVGRILVSRGETEARVMDVGLPLLSATVLRSLGFMEAIAIARQLEQKEPVKNSKGVELYKYPTPVNSNQELFGQGLGNIASSISGAYPVSGSFSRSAVNESVGSYSPISSITTMLIVMVTLLYATPLLFALPESTLGIIVIFAVVPLIRINKMSSLLKNDNQKGIVTWATFFSTLIFPILSIEIFSGINTHIWTGIIFGFLLSLLIERKPSTV